MRFTFAVSGCLLKQLNQVLSLNCTLDFTKFGRIACSLAMFPIADLCITDLQGCGHMDQ